MYNLKYDITIDNNFFRKFISILIYLLPLALVSGPFFSDLFLSLSGIYFIIISIKYRLWSYYKNKFVYYFFFFYFYILILSSFSLNPILSFESSLFYFRYIFFTLCVVYLIKTETNFIKNIYLTTLITLTVVILDAYYQFFSGTNIFGNYPLSETIHLRFSGMFGDELVLGRYLVYIVPFFFALMSMQINLTKIHAFIGMTILVLSDILIYLSGERTAFFLLTVSTVTIILLIKRFKYIRLATFILSIITISILTIYNPGVYKRNIELTVQQTGIGQESHYIFSERYQAHFESAFKMFLVKPITGFGPKMYREICKDERFYEKAESCTNHPHNTYIQLMAETGLIGTLMVVLLFMYIIMRLFKQFLSLFKDSKARHLLDYEVCLLATLMIILWPFSPSLNFFNNWISILYFLPLPFLLCNRENILKKIDS